jgi:hypothetical protein
MESSAVAGFGIYLLLAFIVPGFCYLLILAFCFPSFVKEKIKFCSGKKDEATAGGKDDDGYSAAVILGLAIVAGLLISSVPFAIEMVLRHYSTRFDNFLPGISPDTIALMEAGGRNLFFLQLLCGSAIMHFNVGLGIMLILLVYMTSVVFANGKKTIQPSFWKQKLPRVGLVACLFIISTSNLIDAKKLYGRSHLAIDQISKLPPMVPSEIKPKS